MGEVNSWFGIDENKKIIKIYDLEKGQLKKENKKVYCPICNGILRANQGDIKTWYFSHENADDCNSESLCHWWVKYGLIEKGDKFKVKLGDDIKEFECENIEIEKSYDTKYGTYKPDLTITTAKGEIIFFEFANTNKKRIKDYIDIWKTINNIVVEIKIKDIIDGNKLKIINAIYYEGKEYYEKYRDMYNYLDRETMKKEYDKIQIEKVKWLLDDILKYNLGKIDIDIISDEIQAIEDKEVRKIVVNILSKKCRNIMDEYIEYNKKEIENIYYKLNFYDLKTPRELYNRIYGSYDINLYLNNKKYKSFINVCDKFKILTLIDSIDFIQRTYKIENLFEYCNMETLQSMDMLNYNNLNNLIDIFYNKVDKIYENNIIENAKRRLLFNLYNKFKNNGYIVKIINSKTINVKKEYIHNNETIISEKYYNWNYKFNLKEVNNFFEEGINKTIINNFINKIENYKRFVYVYCKYDNFYNVSYGDINYEFKYDINKENEIFNNITYKIDEEYGYNEKINKYKNIIIKHIKNRIINSYFDFEIEYNKKDCKFNIIIKYEDEKVDNFKIKYNEIMNFNYINIKLDSIIKKLNKKIHKEIHRIKELKKYIYENIDLKYINYKDITIKKYKNKYSYNKKEKYIEFVYGDYGYKCFHMNIWDSKNELCRIVKKANNECYYDFLQNIFKNYLNILNNRYNNVNRNPKLIFERNSDEINVIVEIECLNRIKMKKYYKEIGRFKLYENISFKEIEREASNIIRNYIYRNKEDK